MEHIRDLIFNYVMASAFISWAIAQVIKVIIGIISKDKRSIWNILFSTGGMPSSHSSTVVALCAACGIQEGFGSAAFAISFVLAGVVLIDASGVRYETGKQSKLLNEISKHLFSSDDKEFETGLKELVGHTPLQVVMGAVLGLAISIIMGFLMGRL